MKKQWKAVVGVLTAAVVLAGQVNVGSAVAAKKVDFSKENNMWETGMISELMGDISPYQSVAKNAPKKRVARVVSGYAFESVVDPVKYTFKYDKKGNLKKVVSDNGFRSTDTYRYDADGLPTESTYTSGGRRVSTTTVETDGKGRIVSTRNENKDGVVREAVFKYKGSNLVREKATHNVEMFPPTDHILKRNASGKLISRTTKYINSGEIGSRWKYQYDGTGRMVSMTLDRMNGKGLETFQLTYDADGYLTRLTKRDPGDDSDSYYWDLIYETVK